MSVWISQANKNLNEFSNCLYIFWFFTFNSIEDLNLSYCWESNWVIFWALWYSELKESLQFMARKGNAPCSWWFLRIYNPFCKTESSSKNHLKNFMSSSQWLLWKYFELKIDHFKSINIWIQIFFHELLMLIIG